MPQPSKKLLEQLQTAGLSKNETLVYTALLTSGLTTTGPLLKKTGLHSQLVYHALEDLQDKKLASSITKRNRKHFQASNPDMLLNNAHRLEDTIRAIIPELKRLEASSADQIEVKILYAHEGFISNLHDVIDSAARHDRVMRIIGGAAAKDFYRVIGDWYPEYLKLLSRNRVAKWQTSPSKTSDEFKEKFAREEHTILKIMPPAFASITQTRITHELVTIEIYDVETIIIQIWNKALAASYRVHFDFLWKQGRRYIPRKKQKC